MPAQLYVSGDGEKKKGNGYLASNVPGGDGQKKNLYGFQRAFPQIKKKGNRAA